MGFLKELFEKKLRTAGSQLDEHGFEVGRSAQSEWNLPQLRPQQTLRGPENGCAAAESAGSMDVIAYLVPQGSSKSFTHAVQRKQQVEQAEKAQQAFKRQASVKQTIKYDSVSQFSQKVELYRGSVATVFKAVCIATNLKVIIKAYYKQKMHPKHFHKLHREIAAMKMLNGPYVSEFYATFEDSQCVYIIMEYCEGGDLFKTMLMHGGLLDEQWVCVEVITPLLRILEKMHSLKLLHRDIKPENIFLTGLGKFKLGDFGLALKADEELPFSRSGTLDYMAPEVLKNPSVPFQEGKSVDLAMLKAKGVKPYGPSVDVWAAGVLAYELVCGRPPFEVEDEAQTAMLIMYNDAIKFPPNRSPQWSEFVKAALIKDPDMRPTATALLKHPWIVHNLQHVVNENHRLSKEMLLQPLPLDMSQQPHGSKNVKRTISLAITASSRAGNAEAPAAPAATLAALPVAAVPTAAGLTLPASFPATPTGATRQLQHLQLGAFSGDRDNSSSMTSSSMTSSSSAPTLTSRRISIGGSARPSNLSVVTSSASGSGGSSPTADKLRDIQALVSAEEHQQMLPPASPKHGFAGSVPLSHLNPAAAAAANGSLHQHSILAPGSRSNSFTGLAGAAAAGAAGIKRPGLGLMVSLPADNDGHEPTGFSGNGGSSDGLCYSPSTPVPKAGIKERMKFYFQRQAGGTEGF